MKISFSPKQLATIQAPFDYTLEVNEGTPRSGKTSAGVFRFARYLIETPDENHLVVAYNAEQAFRLIMDCDGLGLLHIFGAQGKISRDDKGDHLLVSTPNGKKKVFWKGGGKADSHKAITGMSLGSVVFCEINLLHMDMIQECFRRTFAAKKRYHLADLNPPSPNHPVIKQVFDVQRTRWQHWTIHDNPILTDERKAEIKAVLEKNPYLYARDWEGKRVMPDGVIYAAFSMTDNVIAQLDGHVMELYFAADGGQSDATSCSCNIVTRHTDERGNYSYRLNRVAHYYHSGKDTGEVKAMSVYAREIADFITHCETTFGKRYSNLFVDPACKSLREELHLLGFNTERADNNSRDIKGSVKGIEVGIERAQNVITNKQFMLVETSSRYDHYNFLQEIGMYARDKNGKPLDDYNHAMDEFRYSVNYFYKHYVI